MATNKDLKKILAKGLTGKEAGRLILQDSWDADHGREGLLSETDIRAIKSGLKTTRDIEDYNRLIEIYRLVDFTLKEARILALEAENILLLAGSEIEVYNLEDEVRTIQIFHIPAIVTQKQYEELKARQKENRLREAVNLKQILNQRAEMISSPEIQTEHISGDEEDLIYGYLIDFLQENHPDLWRQVVSEILEVIKAGGIHFIQITGKDQEKLEEAWQEIHSVDLQDSEEPSIISRIQTIKEGKRKALEEEEERLCQALYEAGSKTDPIQALEKLLAGSLSEDEEYTLLEYTFCRASDLYKAGLPEWIQDIDTYIPDLDEETSARPAGMLQSSKVAIIQTPDPEDLDERGYWIDKDPLKDLSDYRRKQARRSEGSSLDMADFLIKAHSIISEKIKTFLAMQAVIEAVSKVTGVDFSEDMEGWYKDIQNHINLYNIYLSPWHDTHYLGMPKLNTLKIGRLKATARSIRYYEDRMSIALGRNWMRESLSALEFETDDKDSLAEQVIGDLDAIKKSEEA